MGYINRFLLLIYALAIAAVALGTIVLCFHILPTDEVLNEVKFLLSRWETIATAAVVFLLSVHLLGCAVSTDSAFGHSSGEFLLLTGATGKVTVTVEAIKNLIEKSVLAVSGVRDVKSKVKTVTLKDGSPELNIQLFLSVGQDRRVTGIADSVRNDVIQNVEKVFGLAACNVEVEISDHVSGTPSKGPRVV